MPIYEIVCHRCRYTGEVIVLNSSDPVTCPGCGSVDTQKLMSPTSSMTGKTGPSVPGPGDTGCCGQSPGHSGCAGPGSCCGRTGG
jgi:putative FmdB family regulatory protein